MKIKTQTGEYKDCTASASSKHQYMGTCTKIQTQIHKYIQETKKIEQAGQLISAVTPILGNLYSNKSKNTQIQTGEYKDCAGRAIDFSSKHKIRNTSNRC